MSTDARRLLVLALDMWCVLALLIGGVVLFVTSHGDWQRAYTGLCCMVCGNYWIDVTKKRWYGEDD